MPLLVTLSGGPGTPICEGFSLPLATSIALILAATAAAASRAPVGAASASLVPPEPGPGWSHLLRRLKEAGEGGNGDKKDTAETTYRCDVTSPTVVFVVDVRLWRSRF